MSFDAGVLPAEQVAELLRAIVRAFRAFQMYLPNNPMYVRAADGLREAFVPVWDVLDEVPFLVHETRIEWEGETVYDQASKSESFAWGLYKDGLRLLVLRKGVEEEEFARFLTTVSRARQLAADAADDLLTLLWEQEFRFIEYRFAEVVSDPWVLDPQALMLEAQGDDPDARPALIQQEVQQARLDGVVDPEEFDSTLYFLDEAEISALAQQVEEEYTRDLRSGSLAVLFDMFELEASGETREEILGVLEMLFPNLLIRGEFRMVAMVLRELRGIGERLKLLDAGAQERIRRFEAQLSEPASIAQLLQGLDEATDLPPRDELGEVLRELRPHALGSILIHLPGLATEAVRDVIGAAAERLALENTNLLVSLLGELEPEALPEAIRLTGRLNLLSAVPELGRLVSHREPGVRASAVEVLGQLGTPGALAALEPALEDEERVVRAAALAAVVHRTYAGAVRKLEAAVAGRSRVAFERAEQRQVFEAYAVIAGPRAVEPLRDLALPGGGLFKRRVSADTRTCAVYALGKIRTPDVRQIIEEVARDKDLPVRHAANSILREWPG